MFSQLDLSGIKTNSVLQRTSKITLAECAKPFDEEMGTFRHFVDSLPVVLKAKELKALVDAIIQSRQEGLPVIFMFGAHVIKVGLSPVIIDLLERGVITAVAMNSATSIHDAESALFGVTSEDVASNLLDGSFGMWKETGEFINGVLNETYNSESCGYGEALGKALISCNAPHLNYSILATCVRLNIPVSVHAAIGTDIVHQQPTMNGAATGELSFRDFKVLAHSVKDLNCGGAVLNIGSAVILPEVFLKALTVARNLGYEAKGFSAANFDMIQHYRPNVNVVHRPTLHDGTGFTFTGHHEIIIPLLAGMIKLRLQEIRSNG